MKSDNKDELISVEQKNKILDKIKSYFNAVKSYINSIKMPRMLDFIIKLDAKDPYQPTLKEAIKDAPPSQENWIRLGLEKTWFYFVVLAIVLAIWLGKDALIFFINIASYGILLIPLGLIGYWFWKSIR